MRQILNEVLSNAKESNQALFAFNVQNLSQAKALIRACNITGKPSIIQVSARTARAWLMSGIMSDLLQLRNRANVYFHLDHCDNRELIRSCVYVGFDSVMFDGSRLTIDENIKNTRCLAEEALPYGCLIEGEVGIIGGVEDGLNGEGGGEAEIKEFEKYCKNSKANMIAPAIGNAHGHYIDNSVVQIDKLKVFGEMLDAGQYLVLHGGTGLSKDQLMRSIDYGVVKINISTELKHLTAIHVREAILGMQLFDEIKYNVVIEKNLTDFFAQKLNSLY